jgi:hypothetical protein
MYQSKRGRAKTPVVDIVLFKECFMSTLETAFELDHARFMIASQGKVPRLNWPYKEIFRCLAENKEPESAADWILDALGAHYEIGAQTAAAKIMCRWRSSTSPVHGRWPSGTCPSS